MKTCAVLLALIATAATSSAWVPDVERFPFRDNTGYPDEDGRNHTTWVYATKQRDMERMLALATLFPRYTFDSASETRPGWRRTAPKARAKMGYYILVDGGDVTFIVTKDRAAELNNSRMLAYLVISELVKMWREHGGYSDATVSFAFADGGEPPVVFAVGLWTDIGVKLVMSL